MTHKRKYHSPHRPAACSKLLPKNFAGLFRVSGSSVFVYGNLICVCAQLIPHFLQYFVCQESSQEFPPFPHTLQFSRQYFHIAPQTIVLHLTSVFHMVSVSLLLSIAVVDHTITIHVFVSFPQQIMTCCLYSCHICCLLLSIFNEWD